MSLHTNSADVINKHNRSQQQWWTYWNMIKRNINLKPSLNPMSKRTFPLTNVKQTCQFNTHEHDQDYHMNDERSLSWRSPNNETYLNRFLGFHHSNTKRGFWKTHERKWRNQNTRHRELETKLWRAYGGMKHSVLMAQSKSEKNVRMELSWTFLKKALFALSFIETNKGRDVKRGEGTVESHWTDGK